jgi:hypothetical protein
VDRGARSYVDVQLKLIDAVDCPRARLDNDREQMRRCSVKVKGPRQDEGPLVQSPLKSGLSAPPTEDEI